MKIHSGFALRDLVAAIAVIAFGSALFTPWTKHLREGARAEQCKLNLKRLGVAMHNYHDVHKVCPPGIVDDNDQATGAYFTGFHLLLPFLEEKDLYNATNFRAGGPPSHTLGNLVDASSTIGVGFTAAGKWNGVHNSTVVARQMAQFLCPTNRSRGSIAIAAGGRVGATDYGMSNGGSAFLCGDPQRAHPEDSAFVKSMAGYFGINTRVSVRDVKDGTSLTVAIGEISGGEAFLGWPSFGRRSDMAAARTSARAYRSHPVGVDQGWAMAAINGSAEGVHHGAVLYAAAQSPTLLATGRWVIASDPKTEFHAKMTPGFVMHSQDSSGADCSDTRDRLSEARSAHSGGCHFLFGDGTVRFVSENVDVKLYVAIHTIEGKEISDDCDF
jgi:hypothetical protein